MIEKHQSDPCLVETAGFVFNEETWSGIDALAWSSPVSVCSGIEFEVEKWLE
jgi:hypothetical protein